MSCPFLSRSPAGSSSTRTAFLSRPHSPSSTIWSPGADIKSQFFPGCSTPVPDNIKPLPSPKGGFKIKAAEGRRRLCPQTSLWC